METLLNSNANPLLLEAGLSEADNKLAERKYFRYNDSVEALEGIQPENQTTAMEVGAEKIGITKAARALGRLELTLALRNATKHYQKHETEYQIQAVKDAYEVGVDTTFGQPDQTEYDLRKAA